MSTVNPKDRPNNQFYLVDMVLKEVNLLGEIISEKIAYTFVCRLSDIRKIGDCLGPNAYLEIYSYPECVPCKCLF